MSLMTSTATPNSPEFQRNREAYELRIDDLHERRERALIGGPEKARLLHKKRKQLLPRERLAAVLDPGSPFLEFGQLAGDGLYAGVPPGGSIITGVGLVCGRACMLMIHDATVKGGTYYGITAKKHVRAQMFAWQHRLVDKFAAVEASRSLLLMAALHAEHPDAATRSRAVSAAKAAIGERARYVAQQAVQLHGGVGMTEELDIGHYFRRLTLFCNLLGSADHHLQRFAALRAAA